MRVFFFPFLLHFVSVVACGMSYLKGVYSSPTGVEDFFLKTLLRLLSTLQKFQFAVVVTRLVGR
jgi:hypothetical protein